MPVRSTNEYELLASAAQTNTTVAYTNPISVKRFTEGVVLVDVTA